MPGGLGRLGAWGPGGLWRAWMPRGLADLGGLWRARGLEAWGFWGAVRADGGGVAPTPALHGSDAYAG
jgi:hypothetical protein